MCSVDEDVSDVGVVQKPSSTDSRDKMCMKCGVMPAVAIARMNDPFCIDCFEVYLTHRFRATFGKAKIVRQGEEVLVGFTGGVSSRVLLKLIEDGLHKDAPKKLRFIPTIICIDESVLWESSSVQSTDSSSAVYSRILHIAANGTTTFPVIYTRLEEILGSCVFWHLKDILKLSQDDNHAPIAGAATTSSPVPVIDCTTIRDCIEATCPVSPDLRVELVQLFDSVKSLTAKEHLLHLIRRKLFHKIASKLGFTKVLVGDNASLLSVRLLANISQGRGATLPLDTAFCDDRSEVSVLRPLREFPLSEISTYCKLKKLTTVDTPPLQFASDNSSINRLTEAFISGLQADYPSTISTIFRTGDKLSLDVNHSLHKCPLCQVPVGAQPDEDVFNHIKPKASANVFYPNILDKLCYGCCLTVQDMVLSKAVASSLMKL